MNEAHEQQQSVWRQAVGEAKASWMVKMNESQSLILESTAQHEDHRHKGYYDAEDT